MKGIAICGASARELMPNNQTLVDVRIRDCTTICGFVPLPDPVFDRHAPANRRNVLIRVRAFSCNYRDLGLIFNAISQGPGNSFFVVGSEFVGEVLDIGPEVSTLRVGDRVIGDNHFTTPYGSDGIPTNNASKEYLIFDERKLIGIPSSMPDTVAAAFSIGAQTAYSMIRKAQVAPGQHILITSARSNTALFLINALKKYQVNIYATATSLTYAAALKRMGARAVFYIDPVLGRFAEDTGIKSLLQDIGGIDCVFDPFFDLNLVKIIDLIRPGGRYITCGLVAQHEQLITHDLQQHSATLHQVMSAAIVKNVAIIGNNLGITEDLRSAIHDYDAGLLDVAIDLVCCGKQVARFFNRTYNSRERFGKVVYTYS